MEQRLKIPPTKSALLTLKRQVHFLEQGYSLLERKRELLTRLVYERLASYRRLRGRAQTCLDEAYRWLAITQMRMGSRMLRQAGLAVSPAMTVRIIPRSSLGVEYPSVAARQLPVQRTSLLWSDASLDETRNRLAELAVTLAELGEAEMALQRMLAEQRKTQKRVNALKYNVIPRYRATIRFVDAALEEEERNTLFQVKVLREREQEAGGD